MLPKSLLLKRFRVLLDFGCLQGSAFYKLAGGFLLVLYGRKPKPKGSLVICSPFSKDLRASASTPAPSAYASAQEKLKKQRQTAQMCQRSFKLQGEHVVSMKVLKANSISSNADLSVPLILESCGHVQEWSSNAALLQVITNFGALQEDFQLRHHHDGA